MATIDDTNPASRLGSKLRDGLALAQTRIHTIEEQARSQWESLPMQARAAIERLAARIRVGLDLPSRSEMVGLVDRIEELDQKLEALASRQRAALQAPAPVQEPPAPVAVEGDSSVMPAAEAAPAEPTALAAEEAPADSVAAIDTSADASAGDQQTATPAKADDAPSRNGARGSKKGATRTKKARSNSAAKTISAGGNKKNATAGQGQTKSQSKGKSRSAGKTGQAGKRD